jgi:hypothetical protein
LKPRIILPLLLAILTANCSKKKDDNSLRNLLILGILTQPKAETVTLSPGRSLRQTIALTAGTKFTLQVSQKSSTSSSLYTRATSCEKDSQTATLVDSTGKMVQGLTTVPGMVDKIEFTPDQSSNYGLIVQSECSTTSEFTYSGGNPTNTLASENSIAKQLEGTRKYGVEAALLAENILMVTLFEVTALASDGTPTYQMITNAVVSMGVSGKQFSLPYNSNHLLVGGTLPFNGYAYTLSNSEKTGLSTNPVTVSITHPSKSDLILNLELLTYPTFVSNVKMNGKETLIGSSASELTTTSDVDFTWDNATSNKPENVRIEVLSILSSGKFRNSYVYPTASSGKYTLKKELLKYLTQTSTNDTDNCIGIQGGAGSSSNFNKEFYAGIGIDGNLFKSGLSIGNFKYTGQNPSYGWVCEVNTKNIFTNATYSSAGLPTLTVK